MIDPIIPLAVAVAEGRGTYALLLGSGVSRDAQIPTGSDIFWDTLGNLRHMQALNTSDRLGRDELQAWFEASEFKGLGYSEILAELFPSQEERRRYLSGFFQGKEPGDAHRRVIALVRDSLVRVIVTTNFDQLLEKALEAEGLEFDSVYSSEDLANIRPREHSPCRIVKLHGDYKNLNIRNTPEELETLEPAIAAEFKEIVDRYGLVTVGYSGGDAGVMSVLEDRSSKYTLYWTTRGQPSQRVKDLVRAQDGRFIERQDAAAFFEELMSKVARFQTYPSGDDPALVVAQTKRAIRSGDRVAFRDLSKRIATSIETYWHETWNGVERTTPADQSPNYVNNLQAKVNLLVAAGMTLIESGSQG